MVAQRKTVSFGYMGAFWSLPIERFDDLVDAIERQEPFDLEDYGARLLKQRPAILDYKRITEVRRGDPR